MDSRSDVWAVGVLLYESATGQRPFTEKVAMALAADIQTKPPALPRQLNPGIPSNLEEIILKCLEMVPERRYQSAKELRIDLNRLQAPSAVAVQREPRGPWWWVARIVIGAAAVVAAGVGVLWLRPETPPEAWTIRPITSFVGMEWGATFSPDASFLAYIEASDGGEDGRGALMSLHIGLWGRPPRAVGCFSGAELGVALGRERVIHACLLQERLATAWAADIGRLAGFRAIVPSSWPGSWRCVGWGLGGADAEPVRVRERDGEQGV